ncbi:MAG: YcgN family cysteine cluster protein [Gammaproteobacteria bacterium]
MSATIPFWKTKSLAEMNDAEWEALCDGCGRCCLYKLEDEDSGELFFTAVACQLLDTDSCRCRDYPRRRQQVSDCLVLRPLTGELRRLLPPSCAYRRLAEGRELAWWHPLVSGRTGTVREAGISVGGRVLSEEYVHPAELANHVVDWFDSGDD